MRMRGFVKMLEVAKEVQIARKDAVDGYFKELFKNWVKKPGKF